MTPDNQPVQNGDDIEITQQDIDPKQRKPGKGRAALVTLLVLVLLAGASFAGWVWYNQSQSYKDQNATLQQQVSDLQSQVSKQTADKTLKIDGGDKSISVTYPYNWDANKTQHDTGLVDNSVSVEDATITSPTGKTVVTLQTGVSGIGGACIASENPDQVLDSYTTQKLASDSMYSYVQYYSIKGGQYGAYIAETDKIASAKQGSNVCDIAFTEFMGVNDKDGIKRIVVTSPDLEKTLSGSQKPTKAQLDAFFASKEFAQAKAILMSAKITKK